MGLSFKDSLQKNAESNVVKPMNVAPVAMPMIANDVSVEDMGVDMGVMTLDEVGVIAAYSGEDGNWQEHHDYVRYSVFSDDNLSTVSEEKDIVLNRKQFNITQEENSQYIPFEMPRYYDGFDLVNTLISIHYQTKSGRHASSKPVNVTFNDEKIRFGWLIDAGATVDVGTLEFEIHAYGTIAGSDGVSKAYTWKTKRNKNLNVLESLCDCEDVVNNIDDTWMQELISDVAEKVADEIKNVAVGEQVAAAEKAALDASSSADTAKQYAESASSAAITAVNTIIADYAKKEYVDDAVASVDVSEQLKNYVQTSDLEENYYNKTESEQRISGILKDYATKDDVAGAITDADISDKLNDYYKKTETYSKDEIDSAIGNVSVDLTGYATTDSVKTLETSLEAVSGNTITNAANILSVQNDIAAIQSSLNSLEGDNKNLIIQYDEVGSILHLYERDENGDITITDGDKQVKVKEIYSTIITGAGGGGDSLVSTIKLSLRQDGEDSYTVLYGDNASLNYNLSTRKAKESQDEHGNDVTIYEEAIIAGDITLTLYRDNVYLTHFTVTKTSSEVQSGSVDISDYITLGNQVFTITASYVEKLGSDGESITIRSSADWAINAVNLKITELPDSAWEAAPKYGSTTFSYTPIGALEKTIYFKIDDKEPETVVTSLNGTALTYTIPQQTHGVHTLQVWCEGNVGGTVVSTEPYKYVLMFVESGNHTPIIRIKAPTTLEQYSSTYIYYNVLDPLSAIIESVTIYDEDGAILSSVENITSAEQKWEFRPSVAKNKTITIQYKEITESVTIEVTKFPYEINAVTGNLMVDFVPTGRTNSDVDYNVFKNNAYTVEKDNDTGEEIQKEIPITWNFSDNFDWINGGWKTDANGDTYFCVKSGTSVDINYNLFGTDGVIAKKDANGEYTIAGTGKEFKLIFKTTNVAQANATWLQCVDVADKKSLGIRMEAQNAYIDSGLGTLEIPYVDNDVIEFDMNIVPMTKFLDNGEPNLKVKAIPMIMTYEDGTPVQPKVISSASTSFKHDSPKPITIGSEYCDVHIYRMKVYERYLEDKEIITNFIADARSGVEMAKRYIKNDIYPIEDKQKITPESVAAACPDLKVYVLSAPYFTNDKGNKVENTTIRQIHNTGTKEKPEYDASENWTATGATHNGQGTSSNEYGYSGRNLEFNMKKATITLNDNTTVVKEIQLSPTSYPTNYLNFKINIASSESANNALLQKRYDRYLPYTSVASLIDDRKKNSMEFFNCVVFIQETDTNISTHREFGDTDIHFYGIGNIGDSKKTDSTRVNDKNDANEFCVEIMDWNRYLSAFPTDTMVSTLYTDDDGAQVLRFEDFLIDSNLGEDGIIYEKDNQGNYYHSTDTTIDKTKTYYIDILENDDFSEDYTYGFRYIQSEWDKEDYADYKERNEAFQRPLRQKWIEFYRFVTRDLTTNGVEDVEKVKVWKSEFSNWFIVDSALYYYLYTLRYTMVDNRAKNTFWHWAKHYLTFEEAIDRGIAVYDEDKNLITDASNLPSKFYDVNGKEIKNINAAEAAINNGYRMEFWAYDNDTALGIDNAGKLEIPVGVEDDDVDFAGVPYFRAHDSLVFARIAKYFAEELENVWHNTEINPIGKAFDSTSFIEEFDTWQGEFPEELWRLDYERKYKRTYVGGTGNDWDNALPQSNKSDIVSTRFLTEMMNGRKKYQRRCFERNQEIYMSSKFKGEVNLGDTITLRGTGRPTGKVVPPNFTLNIVPFSKMYVNLYSATDKIYYHEKCEAGVPCAPIPYPETSLDFIYVRGASQIQSLGDLSPMYLQTAELTSGAKLKAITLGNATTGYSNDSLQTLQIGAGNKLLEELDIRNLSNLNNTILPVSNIPSLKRVYAQGSNVSEAVFANNGLLEEAYLPGTITRLELRNLHYLKTMSLESYNNLLHLVVMNCSDAINGLVLDMVNQSPDLTTLRATNIDWKLDDTTVLERLYSLIKTTDSPEVMLTGKVSVPVIGQHYLREYQKMWPDLNIEATTVKPQFKVSFVNDDGTVLDTQYIEQFESAIDPITREENPISTPVKDSTIQYIYTFAGWDSALTNIIADRTITATYTEALREYTIKYVSKGVTIKTASGLYGDNIVYDGDIPVYTAEEPYAFYLFNRWDKSGFLDNGIDENGIKTINAIFDKFTYTATAFDGKELADLSPVEIYAMNKLGLASSVITDKDPYTIVVGNDVDYDDIESELLISETTNFDGTNYIDTGIQLFDEDKDFVLAIDYEFTEATTNSVLAQCYQGNGSVGFKLQYNDRVQLKWGSNASNIASVNQREMVVIRHKKGDTNLTVYGSNLDGAEVAISSLASKEFASTTTLVFGCEKQTSTIFANYASGNIHWAKIWYKDLGEDVCKNLALWTHESITLEACGFNKYYLTDNPDGMCSFSLLASHLLSRTKQWNTTNTNDGGWAKSSLNKSLNTRLYNAMPSQIKELLKKVIVYSSVGNMSTELSPSNCYITIPALIEVDPTRTSEPYNSEGASISYLTTNDSRKRAFDGGGYNAYWLRTPNVNYSSYVWRVENDGQTQEITSANSNLGVLIEISL